MLVSHEFHLRLNNIVINTNKLIYFTPHLPQEIVPQYEKCGFLEKGRGGRVEKI
jgi:hypothetical protein